MAKYANYNTIISKAITDFDSIFDALANKSVVDLSNAALRNDTTGVRTEDYATLISRQLYRVAGVLQQGVITAPSGVIANYSGATESLTATPAVAYTGNDTATITVALKSPGYYDSTSNVIATVATSTVSLSGALDTASTTPYSYTAGATAGSLGHFTITPATNTILKEVTIAEGDLDVTIPNAGVATSVTNTLDLTIANGGIGSSVTLTAPAAADLENYVSINLTESSNVGSVITVSPTVSFTAGYISTAPSLQATTYPTITENTVNASKTIYLPKGAATATVSGGGVTITNDPNETVFSSYTSDSGASAPANSYVITVTAADATILGSTTEGWVSTGSNVNLGTVNGSTTRIFIDEGNVPDNSVSATLEVKSSGAVNVSSSDADAYAVTVGRLHTESATSTTSITPGFVSDTSYTTTTSISDITLNIPKGKAVVTDTVTSVGYTTDIGTTTQPTGGIQYYTITPKVNVTTSIDGTNSKEGYLIPGATTIVGAGLTNAESTPLYIQKGSVTLTHGLTTTSGSGSILLSTAPEGTEGTDYYTITTNGSMSVTEGYITSNEVTEGADVSYYVPKAKLQYIENSSAGAIIQVTSAGYVPSGTLTAVTGTLDMAAVQASLSDTGSILSNTSTTGAYVISIAKAATTNAGYISGTNNEGSVSLDDSYYIAHGAITLSPTIDSISFGSVTYNSNDDNYTVLATASGTNDATKRSFTEGYIKAADITHTAIANKNATLTLAKAELGVSLGTATLGTTATGMAISQTTTAYYVTPSLSNATVQATVTSAGYVDTTVTSAEGEITVSAGNANKVYIQAGSTSNITNNTPVSLVSGTNYNNPFSSSSVPQGTDYDINVSGTVTVSGTLAEGYYGAAGSNNSISTSRGYSGTITVAHGKVIVNPTAATVAITPSGITNITTLVNDSATYYHQITAAATGITLSKSGSTTGYVNTANSADWELGSALNSSNSSTLYIRKYAYNGDSGSLTTAVSTTTYTDDQSNSQTVYSPAYAEFDSNDGVSDGIVDDILLNTENTYVDHNILVKLSADAAGTNVTTDLTRLQNRLNGVLARAGSAS